MNQNTKTPKQFMWQFIASRLKKKQCVMLLVVAHSSGSSPGRQAFKMAVGEDDAISGSIGGGIMEVKLVELAKAKLREKAEFTALKRQIHQKTAPQYQSGMICSGEQTVLFWTLEEQHLRSVTTAIHCLKKHHPALLRMEKGGTNTSFEITKIQKKAEETLSDPRFESSDDTNFVFEAPLGFINRLYIIGGGHCALALSELMSKLDFHISLFDDRPDLNTLKKNQYVAEKIIVNNYDEVGHFIPEGTHIYVVIMTIGYRTDEQVLRQLLKKSVRYLGVLGSAAKIDTLMQRLRTEMGNMDVFSRIHAPIGLKINSQTPQEIAISIAAEIISEKNTPQLLNPSTPQQK